MRKQQIPWENLSRTFQHAILITQQLGVRYLWIDSLCIIQDNDEDWREQSGRMRQIYEGTYLTIAATSAASGEDGCFSSHIPYKELHEGLLVRKIYNHSPWAWMQSLRSNKTILDNPLLSRGWCLQERLLSPRVLHYAAEDLVWECKELTHYECGGICSDHRNFKKDFHTSFLWKDVIEEYAGSKLTRYTDVLEALSGVASHV